MGFAAARPTPRGIAGRQGTGWGFKSQVRVRLVCEHFESHTRARNSRGEKENGRPVFGGKTEPATPWMPPRGEFPHPGSVRPAPEAASERRLRLQEPAPGLPSPVSAAWAEASRHRKLPPGRWEAAAAPRLVALHPAPTHPGTAGAPGRRPSAPRPGQPGSSSLGRGRGLPKCGPPPRAPPGPGIPAAEPCPGLAAPALPAGARGSPAGAHP